MSPISPTPPFPLRRWQTLCLLLGLLALALSVIGAISNPKQFFFSYLFAWFFWASLSFGCLLVTMIHQLTGGRWGYPTRRILEAGFVVLPVMLLLFIPVLFGLKYLYPWAQSLEVVSSSILAQRHPYQNQSGFIIRALIFFGITLWMAWCLRRWSLEQDTTTDAAPTRKARTLSGPGVVLFSLIATFIYVDWIMSLEKEWHSTMFAVILLIGQILVAYAFAVVMLTLLGRFDPFAAIVTKTHYHHLGNLLLTFVLFWTYISFGQLLIVYAGDLPMEIDWYLSHRRKLEVDRRLHRLAALLRSLLSSALSRNQEARRCSDHHRGNHLSDAHRKYLLADPALATSQWHRLKLARLSDAARLWRDLVWRFSFSPESCGSRATKRSGNAICLCLWPLIPA